MEPPHLNSAFMLESTKMVGDCAHNSPWNRTLPQRTGFGKRQSISCFPSHVPKSLRHSSASYSTNGVKKHLHSICPGRTICDYSKHYIEKKKKKRSTLYRMCHHPSHTLYCHHIQTTIFSIVANSPSHPGGGGVNGSAWSRLFHVLRIILQRTNKAD